MRSPGIRPIHGADASAVVAWSPGLSEWVPTPPLSSYHRGVATEELKPWSCHPPHLGIIPKNRLGTPNTVRITVPFARLRELTLSFFNTDFRRRTQLPDS